MTLITVPARQSNAELLSIALGTGRGLTSRLRDMPAHALSAPVALVVVIGVVLSAVTSSDAQWWQLYFSQLGVYDTFSGRLFNTTVIVTGAGIVAMAIRLRHVFAACTGFCALRARIVTLSIGSVGANLAVVGIVPVNTWTWLHDRAASGITLSFLVALVAASIRFRRMPSAVRTATLAAGISLAVTIPLFCVGIVNLTVLELVGFAGVFCWLSAIAGSMRRPWPAR